MFYFADDGGEVLRPFRVMPLYGGGRFDRNYNKRYEPVKFSVPAPTKKVGREGFLSDSVQSSILRQPVCFQAELYAVITAHGSDDRSCAEFCVTSHHFLFNAVFNNTLMFDSAGE